MAGISGRPQTEAIMVLTGKDYSFHAGIFVLADTHWSATNSVGLKICGVSVPSPHSRLVYVFIPK